MNEDPHLSDPLAPARGIAIGLATGIPFWALVIWWCFR